ncbi:hypothetical protein JW926_00860 [Candidatus Sumerlaeota bacterium]|nr:hypothetical protein [Candidatus Sumerlaeota bacterium]
MKNHRYNSILLVLYVITLALILTTGMIGIDFGDHWDESRMLHSVSETFKTGILLPQWYSYPSLSYYLVLQGTLPQIVSDFLHNRPLSLDFQQLHFTSRRNFLIFTYLSLIWTFLLIYAWRKSILEAALGSLILGGSWELAYHARWIAPDGILLQSVILAMFLSRLSIQSPKYNRALLIASAVAGGLSFGSKYPGGAVLVPVLCGCYIINGKNEESRGNRRLYNYILTGAVFLVVFIMTTPGILIEPRHVIRDIVDEMRHYQAGHFGHSAYSMAQHGYLILQYMIFVSLSRNTMISLILFIFACMGCYFMIRRDNRLSVLWFLSFPAFYFLYFTTSKMMVVRNLLCLFPFLAILAARGITFSVEKLPGNLLKKTLAALVVFILMFNMGWLVFSALGIKNRNAIDYADDTRSYLKSHPNKMFLLSRGIYDLFTDENINPAGFSNVTDDIPKANAIIFFSSEISPPSWIANRKNAYRIVSGTYEVNWDYYPLWVGDKKVLAVKMETGKVLGLLPE